METVSVLASMVLDAVVDTRQTGKETGENEEESVDDSLEETSEEEAYEMFRRFAERRTGTEYFNQREIQEHLESLGVVFPDTPQEVRKLFSNWRLDLEDERNQRGERIFWLERKPYAKAKAVETEYMLAEMWTPLVEPATEPDIPETSSHRAEKTALPKEEIAAEREREQNLKAAFKDYVLAASRAGVKANKLNQTFYEMIRVNHPDLQMPDMIALVDELSAAGEVYKEMRGGAAYYTDKQPVKTRKTGESTRPKANKQLIGTERDIAMAVLMVFLEKGVEANQKFSNAALARRIDQHSNEAVDPQLISKIMRRLTDLGMMQSSASELRSTSSNSTSKSKRNAFRGELATPALRKFLQSQEGQNAARNSINNNVPLKLTDE